MPPMAGGIANGEEDVFIFCLCFSKASLLQGNQFTGL